MELIGNPNVVDMEYAVRGPIPARAGELKRQGRKIIPCNIGNPQALGQRPISYYREVLSLARGECLTLREVGERMDRSPEAVRKLLDRALSRLGAEFGRLRGESRG